MPSIPFRKFEPIQVSSNFQKSAEVFELCSVDYRNYTNLNFKINFNFREKFGVVGIQRRFLS